MKIIRVIYPFGEYSIKVFNRQLSEICRFKVAADQRGRGYGTKMLSAAVVRCPTPLMIATVRYDNRHWWWTNIHLGFKLVDRIYKTTGDVLVFLRNKSASFPR